MYHRQFQPEEIYYLSHGGPGSGRYPLGSGDRPYQHKRWTSLLRPASSAGYLNTLSRNRAIYQQRKNRSKPGTKKYERNEQKIRNNTIEIDRVLEELNIAGVKVSSERYKTHDPTSTRYKLGYLLAGPIGAMTIAPKMSARRYKVRW